MKINKFKKYFEPLIGIPKKKINKNSFTNPKHI